MSEWYIVPPVPPALEGRMRWPLEGKPVLVWFERRAEIAEWEGGQWHIRRMGRTLKAPTYWCELPEPPEGAI